MKKTKLLLLALITTATILTSCQKQPTADFSMDKSEYTAGEKVMLTSKSLEAHSYKWTMPDGQTSSSKDVNYTISSSAPDGTLSFKLEVSSKNGKKKDEVQRSVSVKAATGEVVFWQSPSCGCGVTNVTINGQTKQITSDYTSSPSCGASGVATFSLKAGTYPYTATDGTKTWNGNSTITAKSCLKFQLL